MNFLFKINVFKLESEVIIDISEAVYPCIYHLSLIYFYTSIYLTPMISHLPTYLSIYPSSS